MNHARVTVPKTQAASDDGLTPLPVDDALAVQEEEADRYLRCIEPAGGEEMDHYWLLYPFRKWSKVFF